MGYFRRLERTDLHPVFFVHDLIPITHPEYSRPGEDKRHRKRINTVLRLGKGVVVNSRSTLDELSDYAEETGLAMPPAVIANLAPVELPPPNAMPLMNHDYFVVLGTIEPRKNHWLLLQLWRSLVEQLGESAPHLVVIGRRGWECENVVDLLERCRPLKGFVHELSSCTDQELTTWIHHSKALLFPSFVEGFGLPLVEALSLGTPVVCSDLPAFREVAGGIPDYAHPLDGKRWRDLVLDYVKPDGVSRPNQLSRMRQFAAPTWDSHFHRVEDLMKSIRAGE